MTRVEGENTRLVDCYFIDLTAVGVSLTAFLYRISPNSS